MARYIDATKLSRGLASAALRNDYGEEVNRIVDIFCKAIMDEPPADVEEVKHGEWIPIVIQDSYLEPPYCDTIKCSECGQTADVSFHDAKYCYECGAKMDGGKA